MINTHLDHWFIVNIQGFEDKYQWILYLKKSCWLRGVNDCADFFYHTAESELFFIMISAIKGQRHRVLKNSYFRYEYLREIEARFENTLMYYQSGGLDGLV